MAAITDPENVHVLEIMECGLEGCIVILERTPSDVQSWIKNVHNEYHAGAKVNQIECYLFVPPTEAAWKSHKMAERISVRGCPKSGDFQ